ncbi:MAG: hypothetical protein JSW06_00300 [Thermoplasmatales archaeon]|nr:MAG: hypothetical protein JSW06_00300 [Thermoplasmatales archaeon]
MKKKLLGIFVCTLLITTALPVSGTIMIERSSTVAFNGNTIYVGGTGPNNYSTIQEGINAATNNDTVFVYDDSSPYYENVNVNKPIELIGEDKDTTIINGRNLSPVIRISANWTTISGFTITNGTAGVLTDNNEPSEYAVVSGNIISDNYGAGVELYSIYSTISRNIIKNNARGTNGGVTLFLTGFNKIFYNNFIDNEVNAMFIMGFFTRWRGNYWDRPRFLPYPIFGIQSFIPPIPWVQWDFRPALKLNEIP